MTQISLNFYPLRDSDFSIIVHCEDYNEATRPQFDGEMAKFRNLQTGSQRHEYWTMLREFPGSKAVQCDALNNVGVGIDALREALFVRCKEELAADQFHTAGKFRPRIEIVIGEFPEGRQVMSIEPYFQRNIQKFGFLLDFRFHPVAPNIDSIPAQKLSLSLDEDGKSNKDYYADRWIQNVRFVGTYFPKIFPLYLAPNQKLLVLSKPAETVHKLLDRKHYIVGNRQQYNSQFMGIKKFGPLRMAPDDSRLYFIYREAEQPLSRMLFRALRGDTFRTFEGMQRMFGCPISSKNVQGVKISSFTDSEIDRIRDQLDRVAKTKNIVPVIITPFSRLDQPEQNRAYWKLKHAFLSKGIPIQVVSTKTMTDREQLKWSVAGIGLQIFAKAGGQPWKVQPKTPHCLIIGIGQAHQLSESGIERYFAYSILTDSSGVFREVRVLANADREDQYIDSFSANLQQIVKRYSSEFSNFAVHSTFSIRRAELDAIADVLQEQKGLQSETGDFVSLKFNGRNGHFGFAMNHNSRVPYESTIVRLARDEYLVWFEGLQFGQPNVRDRVGGPTHVKFTYSSCAMNSNQQIPHLQDAINLSGANWRGFNAKHLPVSVFYAQLIAKYLKNFGMYDLPPVDVGIMKPWFL